MYEKKYLIQIIKYLLNKEYETICLPIPEAVIDWSLLFRLAQKHSISHLLYPIASELPGTFQPSQEVLEKLQKQYFYTTVIDRKQQAELHLLMEEMEKRQLYFLPVKGSDTKQYYPKSEWRTMGDLDVLYKDSQHKQMKATMLALGYSDYQTGLKHDHCSKPPFLHVELHRALVAANTMAESYYDDVWEFAKPRDGYKYVYQMTLEEQYIYTMVHLLEHFKEGGIGIRFVMDVYVFCKNTKLDRDYLAKKFSALGMTEFVQNVEKLAQKWFDCGECGFSKEELLLLEELEDFIISNGTYGSSENSRAIALEKEGRLGYVRRVVFPNYNSMKTLYPWLNGKRVLLPIAWGMRIVRTVLFRKRSLKLGLATVTSGDMEQGKELRAFYKRCGIKG